MASEIVKTVGIIAAILAALATFIVFLIKQGFKHLLAKDIENFKSDLRMAAFERETRFSGLHEIRMKVIAEIYSLLVQTQYAFVDLTKRFQFAGEPSENEKKKEAYESAGSLKRYFDKSRIYLTEDLCAKFDELNFKLLEIMSEYEIFLSETSHIVGKERFDTAMSVWKKVSEDVNGIKKQMEAEFRRLLGVEIVDQ